MALMIIGNLRGKRVVCWSGFAKVALFITPIPGIIAAAALLITSQRWSKDALLIGMAAGFGITIVVLLVGLFTPLHKLPVVPDWHQTKS